MRSRNSIHHKIKESLGYDPKAPDAEVRKDWRERTSRVCKPCWELKYCPYGPLVEQLPLLPLTRASVNDHNAYLQECIDTGLTGQIEVLTEERRKELKRWLKDEELLFIQALHQLQRKKWSKKDIRYVRLKGRQPVDMRYEWQAAHTALRLLLNGPYTKLGLPIDLPVHELQAASE